MFFPDLRNAFFHVIFVDEFGAPRFVLGVVASNVFSFEVPNPERLVAAAEIVGQFDFELRPAQVFARFDCSKSINVESCRFFSPETDAIWIEQSGALMSAELLVGNDIYRHKKMSLVFFFPLYRFDFALFVEAIC